MKYFFLIFLLMSANYIFSQSNSLEKSVNAVIEGKKATVGVAVSTDQGDILLVNNDVHYPMLSVFKFHIALAVLDHLDRNKIPLETELLVGKADLLPDTYSPLRDKYPQGNFKMSVGDLLKYSVAESDNNACDILIRYVGGTAVVDSYVKKLGIEDVEIKATEEDMHVKPGGEYLNWTTPSAAAGLLQIFLKRDLFTPEYQMFLENTMIETSTGRNKIKGLLPKSIIAGHKTGSSDRNEKGIKAADNDAGFIRLPDGRQYCIAVFVMDSMESDETNASIIAEISKCVYDYLVSGLR